MSVNRRSLGQGNHRLNGMLGLRAIVPTTGAHYLRNLFGDAGGVLRRQFFECAQPNLLQPCNHRRAYAFQGIACVLFRAQKIPWMQVLLCVFYHIIAWVADSVLAVVRILNTFNSLATTPIAAAAISFCQPVHPRHRQHPKNSRPALHL
jgi:hypothetical protein